MKISELKNFPFNDFSEFQKKVQAKEILLGIDQAIPRQWMGRGKYSTSFLRMLSDILHIIPYLLFLTTIIASFSIKVPLMSLLVIPLFVWLFVIHPYNPNRHLVDLIWIILLFALLFAFITHKKLLAMGLIPFVIVWINQKILFKFSGLMMRIKLLKYEDFFCECFKNRIVIVKNAISGSVYGEPSILKTTDKTNT